MRNISIKFKLLKLTLKIVGVKRGFRKSTEEFLAEAKKENAKKKTPVLKHPDLKCESKEFRGAKTVYITHKRKSRHACLFLIGGGMISHPNAGAIKKAFKIALKTGRDMVIPYYPLCIDHSIDQVYDFIYRIYQSMLESYDASNILVTGSSSGGSLGLGLVAHINAKGENVPIPGKLYLSSPGNCFQDEKSLEKGYVLNDKDILLDMSYMTKMVEIMTHGKDVPKYMLFLEEGEYTGLKEAYISYGGDEILLACYDSIVKALTDSGVDVISEIAEGLYHCYPFFPLVKEAKPGWEKMIAYHRI